jgi:hypothetical protein
MTMVADVPKKHERGPSRRPRGSEKLAQTYLESRGFSSIRYEPDGNIPPDFLLDGRIAIEVRRLNQHDVTAAGETRGLESLDHAIIAMLRGVFGTLGPPVVGKSWFVCCEFRRPLPSIAKLRQMTLNLLRAVRDGNLNGTSFSVTENFSLDLLPASNPHPTHFLLGVFSDEDAGGWLGAELERNIKICLASKGRKIAPFRHKYPEWWLLLLDHIGYGRNESLHISHNWDKVLVINPLDPTKGYEV